MTTKKIISAISFVAFVAISNVNSFAQCAMCRTSVESDLKSGGGSIGTNLNTGIIYLMLIPYLVLMTGAYFFFRKQINAKVKEWKNKKFPMKQA